MHRNLLALTTLFFLQTATFEAAADCAAGNPNGSVIESTPTSAFTDHGDGTVTHLLTGLMWKRCPQGASGTGCAATSATPMSWSAALVAAAADTTAGHADWRLPNKKELESIVELCGSAPTINLTVFPATLPNIYWSSSTYIPEAGTSRTSAWGVGLVDGDSGAVGKGSNVYVRLVRGGRPFDSFDALHPKFSVDVDGNGIADPLTDGLLIIRYLFGLRGDALIAGAVDSQATRKTAADIEAYLQTLMP